MTNTAASCADSPHSAARAISRRVATPWSGCGSAREHRPMSDRAYRAYRTSTNSLPGTYGRPVRDRRLIGIHDDRGGSPGRARSRYLGYWLLWAARSQSPEIELSLSIGGDRTRVLEEQGRRSLPLGGKLLGGMERVAPSPCVPSRCPMAIAGSVTGGSCGLSPPCGPTRTARVLPGRGVPSGRGGHSYSAHNQEMLGFGPEGRLGSSRVSELSRGLGGPTGRAPLAEVAAASVGGVDE